MIYLVVPYKKVGYPKERKMTKVTKSIEDYLKGIYSLRENKNLTNKNLSKYLKVAPASVSEMIKKLVKDDYIYIENKEIILSEKGNRFALEVIRKHRIWEVFLVKILDFRKEEIHEEAERLEHVTSTKLLKKLEKFLEYPKKSPSGKPIIYENEYINLENIMNLSEAKEKSKITIFKIADNIELETYLRDLDIHLKDSYEIKKIDPFNGPIYLKDNTNIKIIAFEAAKLIEVYKTKNK